jgi:acetylornithine deacetylase/succinyl-diaminopimelate desuccinylase-like protein
MILFRLAILASTVSIAAAQDPLATRARRYLTELVRLETANPPGNETRAARWLSKVAEQEGIPCELLGGDPARLNFLARLPGSGARRPLLLMAHTDVVPAEPSGWTVAPYSGEVRDGFLYGRGALDDKSLLAAELAVLVELKRAGRRLDRDVILLAEADEESASTGIRWILNRARSKIDAELALNEGGFVLDLPSGSRVYHVQTTEKTPMPVILRARGTAGHGSLPLPDNPLLRLSRAIVKLAAADFPVHLNPTTTRYFAEMSRLPEYSWLAPLLPKLPRADAANQIRARDPELDAQLRTTVSPDVMRAGAVVNVIPSAAEAQLDVRRLPGEAAAEVLARLRRIVADPQVEVAPMPGRDVPATPGSPLPQSLEAVLRKSHPKAVVAPYMLRGATDGAWLRQRGIPVYGVPIFLRDDRENRAHAVDERISLRSFDEGVALLLQVVTSL